MRTHKLATLLIWSVLLCLTASCHSEESAPVIDDTPRAVLVYMVADNSLGAAGQDTADLNEMETAAKAGDLGNSRLIVYHSGRNSTPELKEISADGIKRIKTYPETPLSTSSGRMTEVIADFKKAAPARHYSIILWSHASGWLQNGDEKPDISTYSFGDDRNHYMNVTTLSEVLDGKDFDYIYFDCCYMANVETAYQLRNATDYIAGSTTELPADGMPYDITLQYLMPEKADLKSACRATFDHYNALSGIFRTCTMSLIDTSRLEELGDITKSIYSTANRLPDDFSPQPFMLPNCYLFDLKQYIEAIASDSRLLSQWNETLESTVIYKAATPRIWGSLQLDSHCGLSTYILKQPSDALTKNYCQLEWWREVASTLFN